MEKLSMILPLALILCFMVDCQDKAAMAELEAFKAQAEVEEANKAIMKRWFEEVDKGDIESIFALVDEIFSDDYISHGADYEMHSLKDLKEHITSSQNTYSDMQHIIGDNFAEGNMVATRCTFRATHKGEFMGIPPTGKQITFPVLYIHRIEDGKIKEAIDWLDRYLGPVK
jgi:predicted ester cyclase